MESLSVFSSSFHVPFMLGSKGIKSLPCLLMGKLRHSEEKPLTLNPSGEIGGTLSF